jgi:ATP-dependent DNA helicase RecQ
MNSTKKNPTKKKPVSYTDILKKYWDYDSLKDKQIEVIENYMLGKDVVGLLPTGYGKSMCYLLPPLMSGKVMFIISPLISLMEDQKEKLIERNIPVAALHGNNFNRAKEVLEIIDGKILIVYMSPEFLVQGDGMELATSLYEMKRLGYLAIDESHCISQWGHDFRNDYMKINRFRTKFPDIPIMAVTATATAQVVDDIVINLALSKPLIVRANFDRPNLYLKCVKVNSIDITLIEPYISKYSSDKMIIYTNSRKDTNELAQTINKLYGKKYNINCMGYHAGMSKGMRYKIQNQFSSDGINIIVSTVAFGMGIDQVVRCVLIFGAPNSIEDYYQMIGRAGRDGYMAETILFFQYKNIIVGKHMNSKKLVDGDDVVEDLEDIPNPTDNISKEVLENKQRCLTVMAKYFFTNICRRRFILEYFGQIPKFFCCKNCDNCCERDLEDYTERVKEVVFKNKKFVDIFTPEELDIMADSNFIHKNKYGSVGPTINLENWKKLLTVNNKIDCTPDKYKLLFGSKIKTVAKKTIKRSTKKNLI